jgi:hypothetical protein
LLLSDKAHSKSSQEHDRQTSLLLKEEPMRKVWMFSPHSGGSPIPPGERAEVTARLEKHAAEHYAGLYTRLEIRFRGALCYIDAYTEPARPSRAFLKATGETEEEYMERRRALPLHLGRLRHFRNGRWSYAFYTYSHERYEPTVFQSGDWFGTPEEALDIGAVYLTGD